MVAAAVLVLLLQALCLQAWGISGRYSSHNADSRRCASWLALHDLVCPCCAGMCAQQLNNLAHCPKHLDPDPDLLPSSRTKPIMSLLLWPPQVKGIKLRHAEGRQGRSATARSCMSTRQCPIRRVTEVGASLFSATHSKV